MIQLTRIAPLVLLALFGLVAGHPPDAFSAPGNGQLIRVEPELAPAAAEGKSPLKPVPHAARRRVSINLGAPPQAADAAKAIQSQGSGVPLRAGFPREVAALGSAAKAAATLVWEPLPSGGYLAAVNIASPEARGIRLGLRVYTLPADAKLRFYPAGAATAHEVSGREILDVIGRNLAAGDTSEEAHTYWAPVVDGTETAFEIELPPGSAPDQVKIAVPRISHLFFSALKPEIGEAGACNLDASCYTGTWENESGATAKMEFVEAGTAYICTGTLINDTDTSSFIPYFISANHCISTQTVASTLQTYWFYRASICNGASLNPGWQRVAGGATLLYNSAATDTSFLRLNSPPPAGATYAGWLASLPAVNTTVSNIHHPAGDLQKISFGSIVDYEICVASGDYFTCSPAAAGTATFLQVLLTSGTTELGSSGSGLFLNNGRYLAGTLYGGSGTCGSKNNSYGRFDAVYNSALHQWLNPGAPSYSLTVTRSGTGSGTISSAPAGIECGGDCAESYIANTSVTLTASPASGSIFAGWSGACSGTSTCTIAMNAAKSVTASFSGLPDDGFPPGGSLPEGTTQPAGSNASWIVSNDAAYAGGLSLKSGLIGNSQKSELSYTSSFSAGTVSFARKVSSELDFDFLEFHIDGVLQSRWSGNVDWSVVSFALSAGTHTLLWRYVKDVSDVSGSDAAWIDSFTFQSSAPLPVYRFLNTVAGVHFYTASEAEKDSILANIPALALEGIAYYAFGSASSGRTPVYRFLNTVTGVHFYTASETEKNSILANIPLLASEGVSYYAMPTVGADVVPLYRFLNTIKGVHFYTAAEAEKNSIVANIPTLVLEGVAYYVRNRP